MRAWSPEDRARVVQLFDTGHSASQIAHEYGVSRNAILGVVHRHRHGNRSGGGAGGPKRPRRRVRELKALTRSPAIAEGNKTPAARPVSLAPDQSPVSLVERRANQCAFPLWPDEAGPDHPLYGMVCGAPILGVAGPACCNHHRNASCRPTKDTAYWQDVCEDVARIAQRRGLA